MRTYFMKCATAYEIQIGRVIIRVLRPRMYFWPRRHVTCPNSWVFPRVVSVTWEAAR